MDYSYEYQGRKSQTGYFHLIEAIDSINATVGDSIVIIGQDGINCLESLGKFSHGDTLIVNLMDGFYESFDQDTFEIEGICGKNFQKITNGSYAGLTLTQIKDKIRKIRIHNSSRCFCPFYTPNFDFFNNVTQASANCLVKFLGYDYSYQYNGIPSQTGYFELLDPIGNMGAAMGDTLIIIGEDGLNCGEMLDQFDSGDVFFTALTDGYHEAFGPDTFQLKGYSCGEFHLKVQSGMNNGLSISEIKDKIQDRLTNIHELPQTDKIQIYPNPAVNQVTLQSKKELIQRLEIHNVSGQLLYTDKTINQYTVQVDISNYPIGLYTITVQTENNKHHFRLVKE
jgi:hypothetical protein